MTKVSKTVSNAFQEEITAWARYKFGKSDNPTGKVLHIFDELEEAFAECETDRQKEEVADAGLLLLHLATDLGVVIDNITPEYQAAMRKKFEINKTRTWSRQIND